MLSPPSGEGQSVTGNAAGTFPGSRPSLDGGHGHVLEQNHGLTLGV